MKQSSRIGPVASAILILLPVPGCVVVANLLDALDEDRRCGNLMCEPGETEINCPADCPEPGRTATDSDRVACTPDADDCTAGQACIEGFCAAVAGSQCGNGVCEPDESPTSCPQDCPPVKNDNPIGCGKGCLRDEQCDDGDPCTEDRCVEGTGFCDGLMICSSAPIRCPDQSPESE